MTSETTLNVTLPFHLTRTKRYGEGGGSDASAPNGLFRLHSEEETGQFKFKNQGEKLTQSGVIFKLRANWEMQVSNQRH